MLSTIDIINAVAAGPDIWFGARLIIVCSFKGVSSYDVSLVRDPNGGDIIGF